MLKFIFFIFLLWFGSDVVGQGVAIRKSTDIIVIRGKSYYLHTVESGQTLYSICKAYGVEIEEVKALNGKKDNTLSLYDVIKLPYIDTAQPVVQDKRYHYHKVDKGETLYSISRSYGIKPKLLLKFNEEYEDKPLALGAVLKIPLKELDASVLKTLEKKDAPVPAQTEEKKIAGEQTSQPEPMGVHPENVVVLHEPVNTEKLKDIPAYVSEVVMPADPYVKIALLLPFSSKDYPVYVDSLSISQINISSRSEQFLAFYQGILLAVDSLRNAGRKINLHVYDTERNPEKMYDIVQEVENFSPDLIIGPVYGSVYENFAKNMQKENIPVIYPLSSRSGNVGQYPNFVQVNPSSQTLVSAMVDWLKKQSEQANIVQVNITGNTDIKNEDETDYKLLSKLLRNISGVHLFDWSASHPALDTLRAALVPGRENIIVIPSAKEAEVSNILALLPTLIDSYHITVVGLPEWQTFNSVEHETYFKLNTKIFTYSYIDYSSPEAKKLLEKYRKYFYTEPNSLVFKAYDMGLYFIDLASRFRDRTLEAIEYYPSDGAFSRFRFEKMKNQQGRENHGLFIVNFGADYQLKIKSL